MDRLEYRMPISAEILRQTENAYGIKMVSIRQLFLGADRDTFVYKAESDRNESYFLKIRTGEFASPSVLIPHLLFDKIGKHIIDPVKTADGRLFHKPGDCTVVLYPFISGKSGVEQPLGHAQWIQFGEVLRKIHDTALPPGTYAHSPGTPKIPLETFDSYRRTKIIKYMKEIRDIKSENECVKQFTGLFEGKRAVIEKIIRRAEDLLDRIEGSEQEYCLCHGDIHAANLLLTREKEFYIVDWDTLILAPREKDLMFIGGGVADTWNTKETEALFYKGYGNREKVNQTLINYYRYERILVDLAEYYHQFFEKGVSVKSQKAIIGITESMFNLGGVADMAFGGDA